MTVRISLDASAVAALIRDNPMIEVEIKDKVATQVAAAMKRKLLNEPIEGAVNRIVASAIADCQWNGNVLVTTKMREVLEKTALDIVNNAFHALVQHMGAHASELSLAAASAINMNATVDAKIRAAIDVHIKARVAALLGGAA